MQRCHANPTGPGLRVVADAPSRIRARRFDIEQNMTYPSVGRETGPVSRPARRRTHPCASPRTRVNGFRRCAHLRRTTPCDDGSLPSAFVRAWRLRPACAAPATAQLPTTITISDPRGDMADLLRGGQQLEQQRRWGEALAHYEDAIRQYPNDTALQQRFDAARPHYDLERRYADRSFCESVSAAVDRAGAGTLRPSAAEDRVALRRAAELEGAGRAGHGQLGSRPGRTRLSRPERSVSAIGRRSTPFAASCGAWSASRTVASRPTPATSSRPSPSWPRAAGDRARRHRARVSLRRDQRPGPVFHLPHARSAQRSVRPDRGQFRRLGRGIEGPGRRAGDCAGDFRQSRPKKPACAPETRSSPSTANRPKTSRPTRRPTCCKAPKAAS